MLDFDKKITLIEDYEMHITGAEPSCIWWKILRSGEQVHKEHLIRSYRDFKSDPVTCSQEFFNDAFGRALRWAQDMLELERAIGERGEPSKWQGTRTY